jgi:outer membrane protein assembly factor BamA
MRLSVNRICRRNSYFLAALILFFTLSHLFSTLRAQQQPTYYGQTVTAIQFTGVTADQLNPLTTSLVLKTGAPLLATDLSISIRQLFATGLYQDLEARVTPAPGGVVVDFQGQPRRFIGRVTVSGIKNAFLNDQLALSSGLDVGTRFTDSRLARAIEVMQAQLVSNGFHQATITPLVTPAPNSSLLNLAFDIHTGAQARIGSITFTGDAGMTLEEFRHAAHLSQGAHIDHDTKSRALANLLNYYRKQDRLEAEIKLVANDYDAATNQENFSFSINRGPVVRVLVNGAKPSDKRIRHLIPVFEEGSVDEDLLMEGNRALRDYYQRRGFFNVKVEHMQPATDTDPVVISYTVHLGQRSRVAEVNIVGNHYFDADTLKERLNVHASDPFNREGIYSQALLNADVASLRALYQNNGFSAVEITPSTTESDISDYGKQVPLKVVYNIVEGPIQRIASVTIEGAQQFKPGALTEMLNTAPGQPLSPQNLAGDRNELISYYLDKGFAQVNVDVLDVIAKPDAPVQTDQPVKPDAPVQPEADETRPAPTNTHQITFRIHEGHQLFVRNIQLTGLYYTRPSTIARAITFKAGDPLSRNAMATTQKNLYDFALFSQVEMAVVNPTPTAYWTGTTVTEPDQPLYNPAYELPRTVLIQTTEANRWSFTYGIGFEVSTGTCGVIASSGNSCPANGKTGASPRVLLDITRLNFLGREQSLSLRGTYGLLEQKVNLLYDTPRFYGSPDFSFSVSGGYANTQDVTTYVASRLDAGFRLTQRFVQPGDLLNRSNTFVYEVGFRREKVDASSIQVQPTEIPLLSAAVRVSGLGFSWIHDTRDTPLDSHRGTYTNTQEFFSHQYFGAQAQFNRLDLSNSSFYSFDHDRLVIARSTRYAEVRSFGSPSEQLIPLPERLYVGGANSHRGFGMNTAGPRDPFTGYPIGGAGAFVNSTELRLPPPTLPLLSNSLSFVLFHDMGNAFDNASNIWPSIFRTAQPNRNTDCRTSANGPFTSIGQQGTCSFNYFDHAAGLGLRYHTPVGPIRFDLSYNLNPPIYPVTPVDKFGIPTGPTTVQQAPHFNFFFSLGQSF